MDKADVAGARFKNSSTQSRKFQFQIRLVRGGGRVGLDIEGEFRELRVVHNDDYIYWLRVNRQKRCWMKIPEQGSNLP